jgi:hypothetical protein
MRRKIVTRRTTAFDGALLRGGGWCVRGAQVDGPQSNSLMPGDHPDHTVIRRKCGAG